MNKNVAAAPKLKTQCNGKVWTPKLKSQVEQVQLKQHLLGQRSKQGEARGYKLAGKSPETGRDHKKKQAGKKDKRMERFGRKAQ